MSLLARPWRYVLAGLFLAVNLIRWHDSLAQVLVAFLFPTLIVVFGWLSDRRLDRGSN